MKQDTIFAYTQSLIWFTWKWWFPNGCSFPRGWFSGFHVKLQGCNFVHFFPRIKQTNLILPRVHSFQVRVERGVWSLAEVWWSLANWRTPSNTLDCLQATDMCIWSPSTPFCCGRNWMVSCKLDHSNCQFPMICLAAGPANLWGTKSFCWQRNPVSFGSYVLRVRKHRSQTQPKPLSILAARSATSPGKPYKKPAIAKLNNKSPENIHSWWWTW